MFKIAVCTLLLATSLSAHALDEISAISESDQKLLSSITEELGIKNADRSVQRKIYGVVEYALKNGWYSYWVGNRDLEKSKFKDDKVRIVDLIIPNNDRINNITFTYFPVAQQIFYTQKQFVESSSDIGMDAFRKAKANSDLKKFKESDNYAFFQKNGFVEFEIYHVKSPNAAAAYINYGLIDVK
ncbi:MAG: hypothetical protein Q8J96_16180 [Rhodocyclaceae bacterium]|nr:hypothetical protein [Rhodocyclaceae bacterium]